MEALLTIALIGTCTAALIAMHLHLTARPPDAVRLLPSEDVDAEFFRIVGREWRERNRNPWLAQDWYGPDGLGRAGRRPTR